MTVFSDILARAADALPALAQMSLQGAVLIAAGAGAAAAVRPAHGPGGALRPAGCCRRRGF